MRKMILKVALSLVALVMFTGAMAQNPPTPYALYDANLTAPTTIDYVTLRTGGSTVMGYYALPDPVFHPSYVASGTLTGSFVWNWSVLPAMTITKPGSANYATIAFTATGNYAVTVNEQSPVAFGGCSGLNTIMNVTVIAPPSAGFTTADILTGLCGNTAAQPLNVTITENIPNALAAYGFAVSEVVENIDMGGTSTATLSTTNVVSFPLTAKASLKVPTVGFTAATPTFQYDFTSSALDVKNGLRTRYTYTLLKATDATAVIDGIISAISQKSDYVNGTQLAYLYTDNKVVFIVNPNPTTGPIYAIPNNFAY